MNWNQFTAYIKLAIWIQMDEYLHYKCNVFKCDFEHLHMWMNLRLFWTPNVSKRLPKTGVNGVLNNPECKLLLTLFTSFLQYPLKHIKNINNNIYYKKKFLLQFKAIIIKHWLFLFFKR